MKRKRNTNPTSEKKIESDTTSSSKKGKKKLKQSFIDLTVDLNPEIIVSSTTENFTPRRRMRRRNKSKRKKSKKITLQNFTVSSLPENYFDDSWKTLQENIQNIFNQTGAGAGNETLYRLVETLVRNGHGAVTHDKLKEEVTLNVNKMKEELLVKIEEKRYSVEEYLLTIENLYLDYSRKTKLIRQIFLYLERGYMNSLEEYKTHQDSLWMLFLNLLRENVMEVKDLFIKTRLGVLSIIQKERNGDAVSKRMIKNLVRMFQEIGAFEKKFSKFYLLDLETYLSNTCNLNFNESEIPKYLKFVRKIYDTEVSRVIDFVGEKYTTFLKNVKKVLIKILLTEKKEKIIKEGFYLMIHEENGKNLKLLYDLFVLIPNKVGVKMINENFYEYITNRGGKLLKDHFSQNNSGTRIKNDVGFIEEVLEFKEYLELVIASCFRENSVFKESMKKGFLKFMNIRKSTSSKQIAKYIHKKLCKESKIQTDEEIEKHMDDTIALFKFVESKDIFEEFYKHLFASRLLLKQSSSDEFEKLMINKIKTECGKSYTQTLEEMFKDLEISKVKQKSFERKFNNGNKFWFSTTIIKTNTWPNYEASTIIYPNIVLEQQKKYLVFYLEKHESRKLTWVPWVESCELIATFRNCDKELVVSCLQAIVLLSFNQQVDNKRMSFQDLSISTGIKDEEMLIKILKTLMGKRCRIISGKLKSQRKDKTKKNVKEDYLSGEYRINLEFKHQKNRIKLNSNMIRGSKEKEEDEQIQEKALFSRDIVLDAAIVRIMKARKKLDHEKLIRETINIVKTKFIPNVSEIKKRIESLIDKEYLERSENIREYIYKA